MSIQSDPLIIRFDRWVKKLPPEHRSKAYELARSFFCAGASHEALAEVHRMIASLSESLPEAKDILKKSKGDNQEAYKAYLSAKAEENKI